MSRASAIAPLPVTAAGALVSVAVTSGRTAGGDVVPLRGDGARGAGPEPDGRTRRIRGP